MYAVLASLLIRIVSAELLSTESTFQLCVIRRQRLWSYDQTALYKSIIIIIIIIIINIDIAGRS